MFASTAKLVLNPVFLSFRIKGLATQAATWDVVAAVCVERLPVVTPKLTNLQSEYSAYIEQVDVENSLKSNHEMMHEKDLVQQELLKKRSEDLDLEEINKVTAQDFEDACTEEFAQFKLAPIETDADKTNDQTSLERNLQNHLVLLVEQTLGNQKKFVLPQGKHNPGETLRQTAERVLREACGNDVNVQIYGNAPTGYYKYKYSKDNVNPAGAKVFFYYARHLSGQVKKDAQYKWLNRRELESCLPEKYHSSVNCFLIEERA